MKPQGDMTWQGGKIIYNPSQRHGWLYLPAREFKIPIIKKLDRRKLRKASQTYLRKVRKANQHT